LYVKNVIMIFRAEYFLLILVICLAIYDLRIRRVPNWATLPLLMTAIFLRFPGTLDVWLGSLLIFAAWRFLVLGGGDAKLWMALLWITPVSLTGLALPAIGLTLILTALVQLIWRGLYRRPAFGVQSPGAWRTIPYVVWLLTATG
jgi:Flp pilus assembly protein protease CpaA